MTLALCYYDDKCVEPDVSSLGLLLKKWWYMLSSDLYGDFYWSISSRLQSNKLTKSTESVVQTIQCSQVY